MRGGDGGGGTGAGGAGGAQVTANIPHSAIYVRLFHIVAGFYFTFMFFEPHLFGANKRGNVKWRDVAGQA